MDILHITHSELEARTDKILFWINYILKLNHLKKTLIKHVQMSSPPKEKKKPYKILHIV